MEDQKIHSLLLLMITLASVKANIEDDLEPVIQIEQGLVKGFKIESIRCPGHEFYAFLGLPYAKPPVGELRFKEPQPPDPWEGIHDAQQEGNVCPQNEHKSTVVVGNEDCLYANVYTNKLPNGDITEPAAVMVFIHGGSFTGGSGTAAIYGPDYLLTEGIVLVTINYRLGFLGFMCLSEDCHPCNNGLRDQVMALQWVQKNIAKFGGDPNKVTIFGESAGAASVHYLVLSPLAKACDCTNKNAVKNKGLGTEWPKFPQLDEVTTVDGLFHGAISESGTSTAIWAYEEPDNIRSLTIQLGEMIGCNDKNSSQLLKCLQSKPARDIINATKHQFTDRMIDIIYKPTTENGSCGSVFLSGRPDELISAKKFSDVPFIIGITSNEGLAFLETLEAYREQLSELLEKSDYTSFFTSRKVKSNAKAKALKVKKFYFGDGEITEDMILNMTYFITDSCFAVAADRAVRKHASISSSPVYYYYFQFEGQLNYFKQLVGCKDLPGAAHLDELGYLFNIALLPPADEDSDEMITLKRMVKMWTNFAKTGNPTSELNEVLNVKWEPYGKDKAVYLDINKNLSMQNNLLPHRIALWDDILGPI